MKVSAVVLFLFLQRLTGLESFFFFLCTIRGTFQVNVDVVAHVALLERYLLGSSDVPRFGPHLLYSISKSPVSGL